MQELTERIKAMAVEAGLHINGQTSEQRMLSCECFSQAVARECCDIVMFHPCEERSARRPQIAAAIRARFGLEG